jgi:hypothetical protein
MSPKVHRCQAHRRLLRVRFWEVRLQRCLRLILVRAAAQAILPELGAVYQMG